MDAHSGGVYGLPKLELIPVPNEADSPEGFSFVLKSGSMGLCCDS